MHVDSIFSLISSRKFRIIAPFILILFIILVYIVSNTHQQTSLTNTLIPSPTSLVSNQNTHTVESNGYTISYPSEFILQKNINTDDQVKTFLFYQDNKSYYFQIVPGGTGGLQGYSQKFDTIKQKTIYIQNRQFMESTWVYQGKPFFISVIPNEPDLPHVMYEMYLPENNTQHYVDLFNETLSSVQLPAVLQKPPQPRVTLQTPQTISNN